MKKLYAIKTVINTKSIKLIVFSVLFISAIFNGYCQLRVPFAPRTAASSPLKTVYNIKGDFTMVGNTNLTLVTYSDNGDNANDMKYVDIDGDSNTWNSSSATLSFSTENGAIPECSKIIYAGLYWTGRASDNSTNPHIFDITKNGITKTFDKRKVLLKGPGGLYVPVVSNTTSSVNKNIYFPDNSTDLGMYSSYAEVTDYVQAHGLGEYFVADIALREGSTSSGIGLYGGWGMVVVYENSKMKYRNVTVFDGHAFVSNAITAAFEIPISGFNAVQSGNVNIKLGLMAGEGDVSYSGDYFQIQRQDNGLYEPLSHSTNTTGNFFNSSINTGGNLRNPNNLNNTGLDIAMFNIPNPGNGIITNNQTSTRFRYGSTIDTYCIFNVIFSVDAYIPEPVGILTTASGGGSTLEPGQSDNFKLEIKNQGTEAINNAVITIPLPEYLNAGSTLNINTFLHPSVTTAGTPIINPPSGLYPFGFITWDLGTLPLPANPDTILAEISFTLTVTTNCSTLNSGPTQKEIKLSGFFSGVGAVSNQSFNNIPFISGYENVPPCIGEPITEPLTVAIDYNNYVNEPPTASNPNPINVQCSSDIPAPDVEVVTDEADNSGIPVVTFVSDASDGNTNPETIIRTYRVTDDCNNSIDVIQSIIINQNVAPVPDVASLPDVTGQCSATVTAPTATDACEGLITGTTTDPLTYSAQGTYTINWTYDDGNGNTSTQTQTVIVDDTVAPVPDVATLPDVTGQCSATFTAPTATDACEGLITGTTTDPLTYSAQGTYTINWTYDDGNGNTSTQTQTVIVDDITNPVVPTLANVTGECSATATAPTTTDNCTGTITGTTTDPLTFTTQGTFTINWTFDDGNGNSISVPQTVIVDDITNPDAPTLANVTGECSATATAPTTTDNCTGTITGTTTDPLSYTTQGTFTINWTFNDGNGNSITVPQTVIVDDITNPDAPTLANVTGECSATATAPTTTDNCSGTITGTTTDPLTYNTQGTFTINWTFDDGNGNSISVPQTVIVDDITNPVVPTLADVTGECSATATAPTTTDICAGTITGTTTDPLTYTTQGTFTINWTFDDGNGNSITVPQTVIVDDITNPVVPTLANVTGECSATATAPTTTDNCTGTITGTTTDPLTYTTQGTFIINWTFDDGNGNSITVPQTVIVDDITNPDAPTLANVTGECSATATAPTTTDNCTGTITGTTSDPLTYNTQGTFNINWTFDDGNGNSITVPQTVIVDDITNPVVPTLANVTGECSATATAPTTTDNCTGTITGTTSDPLTYNTQGTFIINWTFDDGNGNSITVPQTVIVDDITNPVVPTLADVTGECSATATAPTTTDICAGTITGTTTDPLSYTTQGTFTINWTFDDNNGNSISVPQTVIVDDTTDPVAPVLADVTGECSVTVTEPTIIDNCDATIITGTTADPLTYNTQGTFTINWTFDDGNGNSISVPQTVIVDDVTNPVVPTLANVTGECSATATAPTTTDNCAGTIAGTTSDPLTYNTQGTFTINWTFNDGNGNSITVPQTVIVDDITNPVVPTLANVTGECSATATAPTTTDNCAGTIAGTTSDPLTYNTQGTFTINWTFNDGNGNSITVPQTVIVDDITNPVVPTLANVTGECSATATAPTTTDNCSGTITGTTTDPLTYNTQGTFTINWTFDDGNGNSISVPQTVIVDDITNPVVPTLADVTGECSATATAPTTTDICAGTITGTTTDPLSYTTQGTFTINWTFDDNNGNVIVVPQTVIVDDTTDPVAPVLADVTGECSVTVTEPTIIDNCDATIITGTTADPLTYNTQGTFTINWTFDDGNGNSISVPQTVIVDDVTNPVVPTLANVTGECSATATAPTTTDNCAGTIVGTTTDPLTYTTQGTFTINWTFNDGNGNSITVPQTVIVDDITNPVIDNTNTANIEIDCGVGNTQLTLTTWLTNNAGATATDNCGSITWSNNYGSDDSVKCDNGAITVVFTATDAVGNMSLTTATYLIKDTDAPIISQQALGLTVECDGGGNIGDLNTWLATNGGASATDTCSTVSWSNNFTTLSDDCGLTGSAIVTFTATDACLNTSQTTATFTIIDSTPPTAPSAPSNITYECIEDVPAAGDLTGIDICGGAITVTGIDVTDNSNPCNVIITRTWTFTDDCDNTSTVSQTITVKDTIAPILVLPANVSAECSDDLSPTAFGTATATDNCDSSPVVSFSDIRTDGPCPSTYTITRTWTATDACGNIATADQIVSTSDTTAPDFVETELPQDITVECSTVPEAVTLTATDNCGTADVTVKDTRTNGNCANNYVITRVWTATDLCGLTRTHIQTITVQDITPPVFVETLPPSNLVVECDAVPNPVILTATDICGTATVTVSDVRTNGSCNNNYTLARTWTAKDACGNETKYTQIIVVRDTKAPKFVQDLPRNITVECDAVPNAITLTATDNCGNANVTVMDVKTNGNCPNNYIIARTWTATDECGLKTTHTQLITVQDTKAPVPASTFDAVLNVSCTDIPEAPALKFTDNCSTNLIIVFNETSTFQDNVYQDYVIERTWTVRDECNNQAEYKQTLNVALDEIVTSIVAEDRCFDDGIVNLNDLLPSTLNTNGTWELLEGNPVATLTGNIFNPTLLELSADFLPDDGGIDYKFEYTTTHEGCISITEITMNINANCVVLPCGENDVVISKSVTPNGDAYNEFFEIYGIELCGFEFDVKIFNRWGALIFESKNYQNNWNGTSSKSSIGAAGKIPNGTYYYIVILKNSGLKPFTGPIYLGTN